MQDSLALISLIWHLTCICEFAVSTGFPPLVNTTLLKTSKHLVSTRIYVICIFNPSGLPNLVHDFQNRRHLNACTGSNEGIKSQL